MILIKRKKIVIVGAFIGILWVIGGYVFSSHQQNPDSDYRQHDADARGYKVGVDSYGGSEFHQDPAVQLEKKPHLAMTWLPPNKVFDKMAFGLNQKPKKKSRKGKKQRKNANVFGGLKEQEEWKGLDEINDVIVGKKGFTKSSKLKFSKIGHGENGQPYKMDMASLNATMKESYQKFYKTYGHNALASEQISVHRSLPDVRSEACRRLEYSVDRLPTASIIIAFFNEAWSTLLRTIHSVMSRTPPTLLKEIILVDDGSTMDYLKQSLNDYVELLSKVKLVRTSARLGVIQARQAGTEQATGSVLVFLDSHAEVTTGWIEPLLKRIGEDDTAVVTPVMDIIDDETFSYKDFKYDSINIGAFTWALQFVWIGIPQRIKQKLTSETDPISSPTMPGGLFAISRKFFDRLGGFDPGMNMWGGENFEMSFKAWMCGGKLETLPCSHVGHIFRRGSIYKLENSNNEKKNYQRVAEVWMDEYKSLYYQKTRSTLRDVGDLSSRHSIRERLHCHNFDWYIKNVYPEMFVASKALMTGEIRGSLKAHGDGTEFTACVDSISSQTKALSIWPCHGQGGNQMWMLSADGEIRNDEDCFDFAGVNVVLYPCHGHKGNQEWVFAQSSGEIMHKGTRLCLGLSEDLTKITMERCSQQNRQKWLWGPHRKDATSFRPIIENNARERKQERVEPDEDDVEYYDDDDEVELSKTMFSKKPSTTTTNNNDNGDEYYEEEKDNF